ncbi:MAG: alanine--tRNA ligase [Fermentimonas sp.]|jgi:alanyl-tRNA synthetase|nr:alanine--tRNA ligase [Fermentimonas sp.]NLC86412.1 alanine--tRNA ligase [Bacteroidales bacterium]MDD2930682.1 alanine--tRNA ligase [Fermentimonas sp.]MDD3189326.1 alanine--tRNA ligase [Fermentimonas sp.]MDD3510409.1 alanine--tRNA ligase [Fermentimonas sp.]
MMTSKEIRQSFKDFFQSKEHRIVPSAPMVIKDDPTLMFTNAGMNQFKDVILGNAPIKYPRVADSQKCLRVSGKHNDLEEVGHDTYHHTMFEMLGNWSFGDYFKKEAIAWAWEYLTEVLKLDKNRLYATVFEGAVDENLERDDEAASYWEKYLPKDRIINGNKNDNFWEMGDTGPCGPCSEIHIDIRSDADRAKVDGVTLVNQDHPQVVEIWNLVFMQYNRKADGSLESLPAKVIDTGMGFERLCMAVQGTQSNYDTDLFQTIIKKIGEVSDKKYGVDDKVDIAMRVIADHVRTIAFSITDGQLPSNAKAGYVIRRILRRAVRYGYTFLNMHESFMYKLIPTLIEVMGDAYPELIAQKGLIEKVMKEEEESFLRTLETGIKLLERNLPEKEGGVLSGEIAFKLYDTFGFPLDLTELILREHGMTADVEGFNAEMQKQKDRARNAAVVETGDWTKVQDGDPEFVGYDETESTTQILRYRAVKQKKSEFFQIVLSRSPFYAEMGGQVGDNGWLISESGEIIEVFDTKRENNLAVHLTKKLPQELEGTFIAKIDTDKRTATECNHSATHLMHEALREVLGNHVEQKGSYVSPEVLRFDFSHFQKMTPEEIREVERKVTEKIRSNFPIEEHRHVPIDEAKAQGAMALFGEKYGDDVRTVRFGSSIELCGGTHISSTGRIGTFRIVSEGAISAGVRRIEAVTAKVCEDYLYAKEDAILEIKNMLNNVPDVMQGIHRLLADNEEMKKELQEFVKEKTEQVKLKVIEKKTEINGVDVFKVILPIGSPDVIKDIAFQIKGQFPEKMLFVGATAANGKPNLTVMLSDDLVAGGMHAGNIVREAAKLIQGGGGGQPHFATAGGKNADGLNAAVEAVIQKLKA